MSTATFCPRRLTDDVFGHDTIGAIRRQPAATLLLSPRANRASHRGHGGLSRESSSHAGVSDSGVDRSRLEVDCAGPPIWSIVRRAAVSAPNSCLGSRLLLDRSDSEARREFPRVEATDSVLAAQHGLSKPAARAGMSLGCRAELSLRRLVRSCGCRPSREGRSAAAPATARGGRAVAAAWLQGECSVARRRGAIGCGAGSSA